MAAIKTAMQDMDFFDHDFTPTFINANSFSVPGDQTARIVAGRQLKLYDATTHIRDVGSASFTTVTTISLGAGTALTSSLSSFAISIINPNSSPLPNSFNRFSASAIEVTATLTASSAAILANLGVAGYLSASAGQVTGVLSTSSIIATGPVTLGTTLSVSGATVLKSTLLVGSLLTLQRIDAISEGAEVALNRAFDNTADWSIDSFGSESLSASAALRIRDRQGNIRQTFDGAGNIVINGALSVSGAIVLTTTLAVSGAASMGSTLSVSGTVVMPKTVLGGSTLSSVATQAQMETGTLLDVFVPPGRQQFHPSAAKAWVIVDTAGNIQASYNLTSVTDDGVGGITTVWNVDFSSAAYAVNGQAIATPAGTALSTLLAHVRNSLATTNASLTCVNMSDFLATDPNYWSVVVYGDQA